MILVKLLRCLEGRCYRTSQRNGSMRSACIPIKGPHPTVSILLRSSVDSVHLPGALHSRPYALIVLVVLSGVRILRPGVLNQTQLCFLVVLYPRLRAVIPILGKGFGDCFAWLLFYSSCFCCCYLYVRGCRTAVWAFGLWIVCLVYWQLSSWCGEEERTC